MENIKKFEPVVFWVEGVAERGRILDISLDETGSIYYVENLKTHEMLTLRADCVFFEKYC